MVQRPSNGLQSLNQTSPAASAASGGSVWRWAWLPVGALVASRAATALGFWTGASAHSASDLIKVAGGRYDAIWYSMILDNGYLASGLGHQAAAFYPGFPFLARALAVLVIRTDLALVLTANLSGVAAAVILYRLHAARWGARSAALGLGILLASPMAMYLGLGFSEATFLLGVAGAFLAAERGRWTLAGAAGALAALTRFNGILLVLPLAIIAIQSGAFRRPFDLLPGAVILAAGVLAYPAYLGLVMGDPLLYFHLQARYWGHRASNPLLESARCLRRAVSGAHSLLTGRNAGSVRRVDAAATFSHGVLLLAATATLVAGWRRLPLAHLVWVAAVLVPYLLVNNSVDSIGRYLLPAFPIYFLAGRLGQRLPVIALLLMAVGIGFQAELAFRTAEGYFAA